MQLDAVSAERGPRPLADWRWADDAPCKQRGSEHRRSSSCIQSTLLPIGVRPAHCHVTPSTCKTPALETHNHTGRAAFHACACSSQVDWPLLPLWAFV